MSRQPISRNAPCPCGSGKKYKQCCLKKSFDWVEDDDGTIRRSVPISDELADEIKLRIEDLRDELGREPQDDDLLFGDEPFERVEHELAMAMRQAGTDPALIYAFEETGMIVSEDNQDLLSDEDLAEWHAAVRRYREQHGIPDEGSAPAVIDGALCWSCGTLIPPQAQRCPRCEAKVEEMPSPQERQAMLEMLEQAEPEMMEAFRELAAQCETGEDFVNMVMIGPCVACGSEATTHCEDDAVIDNAAIGRCKDCGQLFCPDCEALFETPYLADQHECPVWEEMERQFDDLDDDDADLPF